VKFLLDTNVYFAAIYEPGFLDRYRDLLLRIGPLTYLSSVVRFELLQGAKGELGRARVARATRQLERTRRVTAPADADWARAGIVQGQIWDELPRLRAKSLQNDILIACTARRIGAIVVSDNLRDFQIVSRYLPHRTVSIAMLSQMLGV
jgi:predicted nucleic acid-binding protein